MIFLSSPKKIFGIIRLNMRLTTVATGTCPLSMELKERIWLWMRQHDLLCWVVISQLTGAYHILIVRDKANDNNKARRNQFTER